MIETHDVGVATEQMAAVYPGIVRVDHLGKPAEFSTRVLTASLGEGVLSKGDNASWSIARETGSSSGLVMPPRGP